VVAEVRSGDELAWISRSIYLRRGGDGEGEEGGDAERDGPPALEPAAVWRIPGNTGRRYAGVSGDHNPIHVNPVAARVFGFPGMIAHGMWMKARCLAALEGRLAESFTTEVEFRRPLGIPGKAGFASRDRRFALMTPDGEKPHVLGTVE
jgi:acyl dehydratase